MGKLLKNRIFIFILGGIVCSSVTAAAYTISAKQIGYTPKDSSWKVTNVADAITDLYSNAGSGSGELFVTKGGTISSDYKYKISSLPVPTKSGYYFKGWYTDKDLTKRATTSTELTKDSKLYASWSTTPPSFENIKGAYYTFEGKEFIGTGVNRVIITSTIVSTASHPNAITYANNYCTGCRLMTVAEANAWDTSASSCNAGYNGSTTQEHGGASEIRNIGDYYYLNDTNSSKTGAYFIEIRNLYCNPGGISMNGSLSESLGVRPVVSVPTNAEMTGLGTKNEPYVITY